MYKMKERLSNFEQRKLALQSKLSALSAAIDTKLTYNKSQMLDKIENEKCKFEDTFRSHVDSDVKELKHIGQLEYNFENMVIDINASRVDDMQWMNNLIDQTVNYEFVIH